MSDSLSLHLRRTAILGLPLIGGQVGQMLVGVTDTLMLGRYSVEALAAATISHSLFFTLFLFGSGFAMACLPMAASALGQDDEVQVRRVARMGLWLSVLTGFAILPVFYWSEDILLAIGQLPDVAANGHAYLTIAGWGMIPALVMMTFRSHLTALERARIVLIAILAGAALNVVVNWLLIFGNLGFPELGLRGAAISSVGVQVMSALIMAGYATFGPGMARFDLWRNLHRPDWPIFGDILRLGLPIGVTVVSESSLFAASAIMMGWIGTVALGAHGIAVSVAGLTFMVHLGLSQAGTVRVGRAWGGGDRIGLRRAALAATILSAVAVALSLVLYLGAGPWIVGLFLDWDDPQAGEILVLGVSLLAVAALFQLVDAGQVMALGFLRGVQDTQRPMVYAFIAYWAIGIPSSYAFGFVIGWGPQGVWLGLVVGLAAAMIALTLRFLRLTAPVPLTTSRS